MYIYSTLDLEEQFEIR